MTFAPISLKTHPDIFPPSSSSVSITNLEQVTEILNLDVGMSYYSLITLPTIRKIEKTVEELSKDLDSILTRHKRRQEELEITPTTVFYFPPNKAKKVKINVIKAGRGKPTTTFELSQVIDIEIESPD